jgi:isopentenyl-diphosphate delta-isomerase
MARSGITKDKSAAPLNRTSPPINPGSSVQAMIDETLILVNERNRKVGAAPKQQVHRRGLLHRAFSIFLVDSRGRFLLQQRHPRQYHSGGLWANSCCGHPKIHEQTIQAARRRLREDLGVDANLRFGFFSRYQSVLDNRMQENEFVYVYFGDLRAPVNPNVDEINAVDFLTQREIDRRLKQKPSSFTYWLKYYFHTHYAEISRFSIRVPDSINRPLENRAARGDFLSQPGAIR